MSKHSKRKKRSIAFSSVLQNVQRSLCIKPILAKREFDWIKCHSVFQTESIAHVFHRYRTVKDLKALVVTCF